MPEFVPESAIDYEAIYRRGGHNFGDEDFAVFKCPTCNHVYLLEYEVDTIYLDGNDLARRLDVTTDDAVTCAACQSVIPRGAWAGPRAERRFQVTWHELRSSAWSWVTTPVAALGDET